MDKKQEVALLNGNGHDQGPEKSHDLKEKSHDLKEKSHDEPKRDHWAGRIDFLCRSEGILFDLLFMLMKIIDR